MEAELFAQVNVQIMELEISKTMCLNLETSFPFATGTVIFSLNFNPQMTWSKPLKCELLKTDKQIF